MNENLFPIISDVFLIIQVKSAVRVTRSRNYLDLIFPMQKSFGNEKTFILLVASSVLTKLVNERLFWSANVGVSMYWSPLKNVVYEFVFTSVVLNKFCLIWSVCV